MRRSLLLLSLIAACSGPVAGNGSFVLHDGSIDGPERVGGTGVSSFEVANVGEFNHTLVVTDSAGKVIAATDLVPPGSETNLEVDLPPGLYTVSCRIVAEDDDGNLIDHYELGMYRNVVVTD